MSLSSFIHKRIADLLDKHRIVVWYDPKGDFSTFIKGFKASNCTVISAVESVLKARRRADEIYKEMNESEDPRHAGRNMLLYIPHVHGAREEERREDPFEVFALAGKAFGDSEDQRMESLARQAMPSRAEEITRLFREGRPTLALLDDLEKTQRYPLLHQVFKTESPGEAIADALCNKKLQQAIEDTPGCMNELLRLLDASVGFRPSGDAKGWDAVSRDLESFILFSEFTLDLPVEIPESLSAVPRARDDARDALYAACERMRTDTKLRDAYIEIAGRVESELRLPDLIGESVEFGQRETFPFQERRLFQQLRAYAEKGDFLSAKGIVKGRVASVWRDAPERSLLWVAVERGIALLEAAVNIANEMEGTKGLTALIRAYANGGWADLDRSQRLFEACITECPEGEEITGLIDLCRKEYLKCALGIQERFLCYVQEEGWPPAGIPRQTRVFDEYVAPSLEQREKVAYFLVDSLRFEMGRDLGDALGRVGEIEVRCAATALPTITGCGMAALMPKADGMLRLIEKDGGFVPALGQRMLKQSGDRMRLLKDTFGDRFFELTLDDLLSSYKKYQKQIQSASLLVVRTQDPDMIGEQLGGMLARRYLSNVIRDIAIAVKRVADAGFGRVVISADHGHILLPEIPPGDVVEGPSGIWLETKRRCLLGSGLSGGKGTFVLKAGRCGIQGDVEEICIPVGFKVFSDGEGYFHGGLSLQEAIVPMIVVQASIGAEGKREKQKVEIHYRSDGFTSRVIGLKIYYYAGIHGKPVRVRVEAYDGTSAKAKVVGEAADCEARDEKTKEVTLQPNKDNPVPVLIDNEFNGPAVEVRVVDPHTRVIWARLGFRNGILE